MISLKKAVCMLFFGVGLSAAFSAWAAPDCYSCANMYQNCLAGDSTACYDYQRLQCATFEPGCTSYPQ